MDISDTKHFNFLKGVELFKHLGDKEIIQVSTHMHVKEIGPGELVFSRLEKEQILYIVRYGELTLELAGQDDKAFKKGDVFGEIAVINNKLRTGTIKAKEAALLFCLNGSDLQDKNKIAPETALKIVIEMARKITSYVTSALNTSTQSLIEIGENKLIEFKSTLRYNLHSKKFGKEIEHAALKTIAAFLNSDGGTLIVGVDDNKNIIGLKNDGFKDDDHLLLHLTKLIQERISMEHTRFIRGTVEGSNGLKVLRIDVKPATLPAYLSHNNEESFFIRTGPASSALIVSEIYSYIHMRFFEKG